MSVAEDVPLQTRAAGAFPVLPVTVAALFLSAMLLFAVQPMFAKMVLPKLGGAPGVWSVAMVFFQGMLLAGYAYAYALVRFLPPRTGAFVHIAVLALAFLTLPLALAEGWGRPPNEGQVAWLLGLFAVSVGLPFFAISANAPLLQAWYALSGASGSRDPYFLYGASNLGSFIALLGYPVAIEPMLRLATQSWAWSAGYLLLAVLVAVLGLRVARRGGGEEAIVQSAAPSPSTRLAWIVYAFVPSALLVAATAHITTDIAAAPFLWVVPLALYLLTFVLVFRERQVPSPVWFQGLLPAAIALAILSLMHVLRIGTPGALAIHLVAFFVATMVAHAKLYAARPAADRLTGFYLLMSLGGVLGGAFAALAAPYIFSRVVEYPFLLIAALALLIPGRRISTAQFVVAGALLALSAGLAVFAFRTGYALPYSYQDAWRWAVLGLLFVSVLLGLWPFLCVAVLTFVVLVGQAYEPNPNDVHVSRNFFGVHRISDLRSGTQRTLYNGTTIHGSQRLVEGRPEPVNPQPQTYYYRGGPMGQALDVLRNTNGWRLSPAGLVGLGAGSLACYREEGERFDFFEIDSKVVDIAENPEMFTFLSACAPDAAIRLGDARLTLEDVPDGTYEVLLIDAFSSDAIPVHLLTREAVELYLRKLRPNGVIVVHISNRNLDLRPVVAAIAADLGLVAWGRQDTVGLDQQVDGAASSNVVALARRDEDLGSLPADGWERVEADPAVAAWTDDFSDIFSAMLRKIRGSE